MREWEKQKFLPALRKAQPMHTARANCDQRLDHLVARALRIGPRIDESRQALHAKRSEDEHLADIQKRRDYGVREMSRPHSRGKTDREADNRQHQSGAQVRLFGYQSRDNSEHEKARQERSPERHFASRSSVNKTSEKQSQRQLCDLRRLD